MCWGPTGKHRKVAAPCRLLRCEQAVLEAGGCVVRLAGLYHAQVRSCLHSAAPGHLLPPLPQRSLPNGKRFVRRPGCSEMALHRQWVPARFERAH